MQIPPYHFTLDDQMNPVHCTQCRTHIPVALSNAGAGLCPVCIQGNLLGQAQAQANAQQAQAQQAQTQQAQQQQVYQVMTGMGICPGCKSQNIGEIRESGMSTGCLVVILACFALVVGICFWPVAVAGLAFIIYGGILMSQNSASRVCNYCGHQWRI